MIKTTVLYGHPTKPESFENYYTGTHIPLVAKASGIIKTGLTKFLPNPDGSAPVYYRMADLYFNEPVEMQQAMAIVADLSNFVTGSLTIMIGVVEN